MLKVLITGSNGFIGKNLKLFLKERKDIELISFNKGHHLSSLIEIIKKVDFIFHLAGINRSDNDDDFYKGNADFTKILCETIKKTNCKIPIIYTSSIKANQNTPYGISKRNAEELLLDLNRNFKVPIYIFRLPNVFGKWCKPNYNSVVATFCNNIIREIPINIVDENNTIEMVYIDDVIKKLLKLLDNSIKKINIKDDEFIKPIYKITVGELAKQLYAFKKMPQSKILEDVGSGLTRALYSTYVSYLPPEQFSYPVLQNKDSRGVFVEVLKTHNSGQFSYFTTKPGVTRGGHYHHSKTEKFLIIKGKACFKFFHMDTEEKYELNVSSDNPVIVETITGWSHTITNTGKEELIAMIWANEIYDPNNPDTFSYRI
jgi:UDP-2-acetamido-2,6-beta-L-arabino-hexul-4-ose reductase